MKLMFCAVAIAALACCCVVVRPSVAQKQRAQSNLRAIQIECLKQYGAYEDPQTKQLKLVGGGLTEFQTRVDAIYACVTQKTGKPTTPFIRSEVIIR